ncbi:DUF2982 domain-containing protein [Agaribacter flavus]|uniref:DUF2982 domain-containing protein n=1 Tax=Agaribacter flavus TaxID=1902781 RepID=A0ABV7FX26_9ALTE
MTSQKSDEILIRASSANNGMMSCLIGSALFFIGLATCIFLPDIFFFAGILVMAAGIVGVVMGFFKLREPKYSLSITRDSLVYFHRRGVWEISWDNIQRVDVPRVHKGLSQVELEMIGFRLKDPEQVLNTISPRLITHLLMEQRPLVTQINASRCAEGKCYGDDLIEDTRFKMKSGKTINGILAMFANRMRRLQEGLGYDIFISANELDRSPQAFISLLRQCQEARIKQQ